MLGPERCVVRVPERLRIVRKQERPPACYGEAGLAFYYNHNHCGGPG